MRNECTSGPHCCPHVTAPSLLRETPRIDSDEAVGYAGSGGQQPLQGGQVRKVVRVVSCQTGPPSLSKDTDVCTPIRETPNVSIQCYVFPSQHFFSYTP